MIDFKINNNLIHFQMLKSLFSMLFITSSSAFQIRWLSRCTLYYLSNPIISFSWFITQMRINSIYFTLCGSRSRSHTLLDWAIEQFFCNLMVLFHFIWFFFINRKCETITFWLHCIYSILQSRTHNTNRCRPVAAPKRRCF